MMVILIFRWVFSGAQVMERMVIAGILSLGMCLIEAGTAQGQVAEGSRSPRITFMLREPAYRHSIFSSQPQKRIVVSWNVEPAQAPGKVELQLLDLSGQVCLRDNVPLSAGLGVLDAAGLMPGEYTLLALVGGYAKNDYLEADKFPPRRFTINVLKPSDLEVYLNSDGVLMVNGKPTFVMGLYWLAEDRINEFVNPTNRKMGLPEVTVPQILDDVIARGFDFGEAQGQPTPAYLQEVARRNFYICPTLPQLFSGNTKPVQELKTNKNVLFWYTWDEMSGPILTRGEGVYQVLRALDPYRPIGTAICDPELYDRVSGAMDILMPDIYPISHTRRNDPNHYEKGEVIELYGLARKAVQAVPYGWGCWGVVQAFGVHHEFDKRWRMPTSAEYRNMCYQYLAAGVRSLHVYSYASSETSHGGTRHFWMPLTPLWHEIGAINHQIKSLDFLWTARGGRYWTSADKKIAFMQRETERGKVCLAVNMSYDPMEIDLELPETVKQVRELISGKTVAVPQQGPLTRLEGLEVAVYLLSQ
jgi:hypothetical protein